MVSRKPGAPDHATKQTSTVPHRPTIVGRDATATALSEEIKEFIQVIAADFRDLESFYNISFSRTRVQRLGEYLSERNNQLVTRFIGVWDKFDQEGKFDWLMIRSWIRRRQESFRQEWIQIKELSPLLGTWSHGLIELCERRQKVAPTEPKYAAQVLSDAVQAISDVTKDVETFQGKVTKFTAYRAVQAIGDLQSHMTEWYNFYSGYDPMFDWWVKSEWETLPPKMQHLMAAIRETLIGIEPGDDDAIVGQPSGRDNILADLSSEVIAYSPEEIIKIGQKEYVWCEKEMIKASRQLGYGDAWRKALEHVKNMYVEPGQQIYLVHELAQEAVDYVTKHDMVTIPEIANETWRTFMMSPERQRVNPFFLGGESIIVSYPTSSMNHKDKLMIMRGNSGPFSRSTVFHELLPGHHLQFYYMDRYRTYRRLFMTPFWIEGWSFYWEMILWDRQFPGTPENKIGMLFWRMHRCCRIIFSLNFHLGKWTPQECIDFLVDKGGHERATAEGEVRRSFNGDYTPLYQAGYMLGALQFHALRRELVDTGHMPEKEFHNRVLKENNVPVELLRVLLKGEELTIGHKPSWKFYGGLDEDTMSSPCA